MANHDDYNFYLHGEIDNVNATACVQWIHDAKRRLGSNFSDKITIHLNSTGGDMYGAFAIIDAIHLSGLSISVIASGAAMSAAFLILAAGTPGKRFVTMNTTLMCHEYSDTIEGGHTSLTSTLQECHRVNERMKNLLASCTTVDLDEIDNKFLGSIDHYMMPGEAKVLGVVDNVLIHTYSRQK